MIHVRTQAYDLFGGQGQPASGLCQAANVKELLRRAWCWSGRIWHFFCPWSQWVRKCFYLPGLSLPLCKTGLSLLEPSVSRCLGEEAWRRVSVGTGSALPQRSSIYVVNADGNVFSTHKLGILSSCSSPSPLWCHHEGEQLQGSLPALLATEASLSPLLPVWMGVNSL